MTRPLLLGALIAGGKGRRFGSDKGAALLNGVPLIDHVAAALALQVDAVVLCGRESRTMTTLPDYPEPELGPLGGLCAALRHAQRNGFAAVLTAPCDLLPVPDLSALTGGPPAVIAGHYLLGYWPASLAEQLSDYLSDTPDRSMRGWMAATGAVQITCERPLYNFNTMADLETYSRNPANVL